MTSGCPELLILLRGFIKSELDIPTQALAFPCGMLFDVLCNPAASVAVMRPSGRSEVCLSSWVSICVLFLSFPFSSLKILSKKVTCFGFEVAASSPSGVTDAARSVSQSDAASGAGVRFLSAPSSHAAAAGTSALSLGALFTLGASELTSSFAHPTDESVAGSSVRPGTDHENAKTERDLADGRALLAALPRLCPPASGTGLCSIVFGEETAALSRATLAFASTTNRSISQ